MHNFTFTVIRVSFSHSHSYFHPSTFRFCLVRCAAAAVKCCYCATNNVFNVRHARPCDFTCCSFVTVANDSSISSVGFVFSWRRKDFHCVHRNELFCTGFRFHFLYAFLILFIRWPFKDVMQNCLKNWSLKMHFASHLACRSHLSWWVSSQVADQ